MQIQKRRWCMADCSNCRKLRKRMRDIAMSVAHEAHTMGRIYSAGGEKLRPGDEWLRVEAMVKHRLKAKEGSAEK